MKFSVVNLGCRVNRVESDSFIAHLSDFGMTYSEDAPDVVIVNTCTVTGEAEKKTRKAVRQALRSHPDAKLVVTGCAAVINPEEFTSLSERVQVVAKAKVVESLVALDDSSLHGSLITPSALRYGDQFPTRVGIKIQDGCDNACSFCIVHVARGKSTSRPLDECIDEARRLYAAGAREIVLTGIDLGNYHFGDKDLAALLNALVACMPEGRIRVSSIEPLSVTDEIIDAMTASDGHVCKHLHIPLQSGSSGILGQMNRHYTANDFKELVDKLYAAMPGLSLSTDIIVGFPGETEQDFQDTLDMVRYCRFSKVHIFRYSRREGTPAALRDDQIPPEIIARRAKELSELARHVREQEQKARLGTSEYVLIEESGLGTTESFFTVNVGDAAKRGSLAPFVLRHLDEGGVFNV